MYYICLLLKIYIQSQLKLKNRGKYIKNDNELNFYYFQALGMVACTGCIGLYWSHKPQKCY